jgi:hypothetical protein
VQKEIERADGWHRLSSTGPNVESHRDISRGLTNPELADKKCVNRFSG